MTARCRVPCAASLVACAVLAAGAAAAAEVHGRVLDAAGAPLADAVVFVQAAPPDAPAPPTPAPAVMDQIDKQFVPHVLAVPVGTVVSFPNRDQIHHHVYSFSPARTFEIPLYKGEAAPPVRFDRPGAVLVGCNIHDWMAGVILVVPTPYFAMTDADGTFTLRDLPPGPTTITAWHESGRSDADAIAQRVEVGPASAPLTFRLETSARRGRAGTGGLRSYE